MGQVRLIASPESLRVLHEFPEGLGLLDSHSLILSELDRVSSTVALYFALRRWRLVRVNDQILHTFENFELKNVKVPDRIDRSRRSALEH